MKAPYRKLDTVNRFGPAKRLTLIEILVVIALIPVLAAMLLPAMGPTERTVVRVMRDR